MRGALIEDSQIRYRSDLPEPIAGPGESTIAVRTAGVCATAGRRSALPTAHRAGDSRTVRGLRGASPSPTRNLRVVPDDQATFVEPLAAALAIGEASGNPEVLEGAIGRTRPRGTLSGLGPSGGVGHRSVLDRSDRGGDEARLRALGAEGAGGYPGLGIVP